MAAAAPLFAREERGCWEASRARVEDTPRRWASRVATTDLVSFVPTPKPQLCQAPPLALGCGLVDQARGRPAREGEKHQCACRAGVGWAWGPGGERGEEVT